MSKYPEYSGRDLYFSGQSYADHYIPKIANLLVKKNDNSMNLKGLVIGNGWVEPSQ